jgi:3-oxoacyl-[acyl-carrier protein] reductase
LTAQAGEPPLAGLRTVVTGASSGIGRAIATAFATAGARVGLGFWRSSEAAAELAAELGPGHPLLQADLGTLEGCTALVRDAFGALEHVDVWVNNAGADVLTGEARFWPDERKLDVLLDVDLKATIRCSRLAARAMRTGSSILNIGWDHAAIDGMAGENPELFAAVAPDVRVNVLCPGWVETAYGAATDPAFYDKVAKATPLGRWGQPEDVAGAAVWLASPAAAFVTGQAIHVNGGTVG